MLLGTASRASALRHNLRKVSPGVKRASRPARNLSVAAMELYYPSPVVMNPETGSPTGTVIFLHGLGDTANGWVGLGQQMMPDLKNIRFIFPTAPMRPITLNNGMGMPGWYDIESLGAINMREDDQGLKESQRYVEELVRSQVASGIPSERIIVGGFSQGGAIALMMLRSNIKLGGVIGLSTYLPLAGDSFLSEQNKDTPILLCHGDADPVVSYIYGKQSAEKISGAGANVKFSTYTGMTHSACPQELLEAKEFIKKHLD